MPEEGFLRRWARVKATGDDAVAQAPRAPAPAPSPAPASAPAPATTPWARAGDAWARAGDPLPAAPAQSGAAAAAAQPSAAPREPSPTLDDVARLTPDSDYSAFVGQGVDKSVQRLALKKLFADPHFNVMDRLDMYMDDYNIPSPVSAEMLASLDHARSALRRFVEDDPAAAASASASASAAAPDAVLPDAAAAQATAAAPPPSPPSGAPDAIGHEAVAHNEAAHATAAHEDQPPGESSGVLPPGAFTHEHGLFHRPNQQLP